MRDHILSVAERLFYAEGTKTVGIDRLIAEANVAKATLYRYFKTKDDLIEAYLRDRHERAIFQIEARLTALDDPEEQLLGLFEILHERASAGGFRGCAFLIAVAENEQSDAVRAIATIHKATIRAILARSARKITYDSEHLAEDIAICYEGALAVIAIYRNPDAALAARRSARILIGHYANRC